MASPPRVEDARKAAAQALALRSDYWWVKERVLPQLEN
jgi:hypothetical protein